MLGFSLPKLLILVALIVAVWYGFKAANRVRQRRTQPTASAENDKMKKTEIKQMVKCPRCGAFSDSLDRHACDV